MSRSYQVNLREFEGEIGDQPTVSNRGACPTFTSSTKSNPPASIGIVEQLQRFYSERL